MAIPGQLQSITNCCNWSLAVREPVSRAVRWFSLQRILTSQSGGFARIAYGVSISSRAIADYVVHD